MVTWAMYPDGLHIWRNGEFIGVIPMSQAGALIYAIAREMQGK